MSQNVCLQSFIKETQQVEYNGRSKLETIYSQKYLTLIRLIKVEF